MIRTYKEDSKLMKIITVHKRDHVIMPFTRKTFIHSDPNYRDTRCALIGILRQNQTLEQFRDQWVKLKYNQQFINKINVK